jgi:hypothetical protein
MNTEAHGQRAPWRKLHELLYRDDVPAPVLRLPVISHDEALRILATRPENGR